MGLIVGEEVIRGGARVGGNQEPLHRKRFVVDFFLVPASPLHLKPVRIRWCGSNIFCGDGTDLTSVVRSSPF